ncbi:MAG: helix-turn-helix domain-containing protein [Candidatus Limnocylindrales bacterium]
MKWLSIGAASRQLGVDPDTLRRWADAGRVETFTTPGGHRRFSSVALERLASQRSPTRERPSLRQGASIYRLEHAYQRRYAGPAAAGLVSEIAPDTDEREAFREAGRLLVGALVDFADAATAAERSEAEARADEGTLGLARLLGAHAVDLPAAIEAFVSARRPFVAEIARIGRGGRLTAAEVSDLYQRSTELLDRLVVRFAAAAAPGSGER